MSRDFEKKSENFLLKAPLQSPLFPLLFSFFFLLFSLFFFLFYPESLPTIAGIETKVPMELPKLDRKNTNSAFVILFR